MKEDEEEIIILTDIHKIKWNERERGIGRRKRKWNKETLREYQKKKTENEKC